LTQGRRIRRKGDPQVGGLEESEVRRDGRPTLSGKGGENRRGRRARLFVAEAIVAATIISALAWSWGGGAARAQIAEGAAVRHITVILNKSKTLTFPHPFSTAVIGAPDIADLLPMTDHSLYVQGKKVGTTNISVFDGEKRLVAVVDLDVTLDTDSMHGKIMASTGGRGINVSSANGEVVLSGEASDAVSAARAVDVAKGLSTGPVIDAMKVAPSQQVMLQVRFLEVDRNAGRDLGVNWFGGNKYGVGFTGLGTPGATAQSQSNAAAAAAVGVPTGSVTTTTGPTGAVIATTTTTNTFGGTAATTGTVGSSIVQGAANAVTGGVFAGAASALPFGSLLAQVVNTRGIQIDALISALEAKGLVKSLAEPNLISQSGEKASFFAGGEVPIPTVQPGTVGTTPTVTVQYVPCGVTLNFVPTVLNTGLINLHLNPQVCEIANTSPVTINGTLIPELNQRTADTTVELRNGQSFAIAGLLQAQASNSISEVPWFGSLPVLGALFRSTSYQKQETDLVVIVTPRLVRPVPPDKHLATPFDNTVDANDVDLFLMGDMERKKKYTEFVTSGGGLQGPYGHILDAK
jgi:pilus assembly protein CpaC